MKPSPREQLRTFVSYVKTRVLAGSSVRTRLVVGTSWSIIGGLVGRALGLPLTIACARLLGKTKLGELGMILSTVNMFVAVAGLGLDTTLSKYIAEHRRKDPAKAGRILAMASMIALCSGGTLTVALLIAAKRIAASTLAAPELGVPLAMGSALVLFGALDKVQTGALNGLEAFPELVRLRVYSSTATFGLVVLGVWFADVIGALGGYVLARLITWVLTSIALRLQCKQAGVPCALGGSWKERAILWHFSLPVFLGGIMMGPVMWAANAILVHQPGGYAALGVFNAANQWGGVLLFLPAAITQAALPVLSSVLGEGDYNTAHRVLKYNLLLQVLVVIPAALVLGLLSPQVMRLYGTGFVHTWPVLLGVLVTADFAAISVPVDDFLTASGRVWPQLVIGIAWAACLIIGVAALRQQGALGMSIAYALASFANMCAAGIYVFHVMRRARHHGEPTMVVAGRS
jgi:O-antigen/teichoic acid export membrane protein